MPHTRHVACVSVLCVGCPQMEFLSGRQKGDTKRDHFARQHTIKGAGVGFDFCVFVAVIASWVPPTKKCCVAFKSPSVHTLPLTSDRRPAILTRQTWLLWPL